jgi:hypothetical protein
MDCRGFPILLAPSLGADMRAGVELSERSGADMRGVIEGLNVRPRQLGAFEPSQLFLSASQGYFYDFGDPASMLNASGVQAKPGEYVRSIVPAGGSYSNFTCSADGPTAGDGFLQLNASTGNAVLALTAAFNAASGFSLAALYSEPLTIPTDIFGGVLMDGQSTTSSGSASYRFDARNNGAMMWTFQTYNNFTSLTSAYSRQLDEPVFHVATVSAQEIVIYQDGAPRARGTSDGDLNSSLSTPHGIGASYAGTANRTSGEVTCRVRALLLINRTLTPKHVDQLSAWARAQPFA